MQKWDVIIIGAGAAGLMCAFTAARRGLKTLIIEHMPRPGKKILISGGGRCNFTNLYAGPEQYLSANPHFCKSALARFGPYDFIALVEQAQIPYYEKKLGQLFCRHSAQAIVDMLLSHCQSAGVTLRLGTRIHSVRRRDGSYLLESDREKYHSPKLVLACGGLSIPKMGASDFGYRILKQFDHPIIPTRPALVPLTLHPDDAHLQELRGISIPARVRHNEIEFAENLLFTHFGLSGPAILQISSYWQRGDRLSIDLLPEQDLNALLSPQGQSEQAVHNWLKQYLPQRLTRHWQEHYLQLGSLKQCLKSEQSQQKLRQYLKHWPLTPSGTSGYGKAEVTAGGADTRFFSSKSMESTQHKGLFCIGELLDVTGWLGGYNFQWAWASAVAAGNAV